MADFCHQCSLEIFSEDFGDLAGIALVDGQKIILICEGCGYIQVDHDGWCMTDTCLKSHGLKYEEQKLSWSKG